MKSMVIIEGSIVHALAFFYFPANGSTNTNVVSLTPSASPGESSLKISAHQDLQFLR